MRFILLLLVSAFALQAQDSNLSGFIRDQSGKSIPAATVTATSAETGVKRRTESNDSGLYGLPALKPGRYLLVIQKQGFQTASRDDVTLSVAQEAAIDFVLRVGEVSQSVTVSSDTPMTNTSDASVSTVVDRGFVENMPLNGRTFQSLIALTPGTVVTPTTLGGDQGQLSVAGQRSGSNYYSIDGVGANFGVAFGNYQAQTTNGGLPAFSALGTTASLVSVDALQEFRLESSTYSPEYGRESGAQVMIVTRSGTNSFHGTVFDYLRNDVLDATDWFVNATKQPKGAERQNDFGGVFGGPIVKNRLFFFFSYEGLRVSQPLFQITDVPSLDARANAALVIKPIVDAFPLPNGPSTGTDLAQLAASAPNHSNLDATSLRMDYSVNSKMTLFGRVNHSPSHVFESFGGWPGSNPFTVKQQTDTGTLGLTTILSPTITDEFHINYSRATGANVFGFDNFGGAIPPTPSQYLSPWQNPITGGSFFDILNGRDTQLGPGPTAANLNRQLNVVDSISISRGSHLLKFGFDFRRLTPVQTFWDSTGVYLWLTAQSFISGATPDIMEMDLDRSNIRQLYHNFSGFGQDTWKVTPRLTLTYGIRWDYNPPPVETNGAANAPYTISETTDLAAATLLPRGGPLWHADWKNFAPRVGLAYRMGSTERPLVLRAGFGQFFDLGTSTAGFLNNGEGWYPYSVNSVICLFGSGPNCNSPAPYNGPEPPFVFTDLSSENMRVFQPHIKLPYSLEWNVALEQTLSPNQTFKISYVGSAGRRLLRDDIINNNPSPTLPNLYLTTNDGYSNYDALQLQFQRRLSHGLQALVSYNWSHSLDLNS